MTNIMHTRPDGSDLKFEYYKDRVEAARRIPKGRVAWEWWPESREITKYGIVSKKFEANIEESLNPAVRPPIINEPVRENVMTDVSMPTTHAAEATTTATKPRRARRVGLIGEGTPVREGTHAAVVLRSALKGNMSYEDIAQDTGRPIEKVLPTLKHALRVKHGVAHLVNNQGKVEVSLPAGFTEETMFKEKGTRAAREDGARAGGERNSKRKREMEAALKGEWPDKPVITSKTNQHRQKHLDKLHDLAQAGEWDAVEDYVLGSKGWGEDTYAKRIKHYRDCLLAAYRVHSAGEAEPAADEEAEAVEPAAEAEAPQATENAA